MKSGHWLILTLLLIIVILWLALCNNKKNNTAPNVTPTEVVREKMVVDSVALQKATDSIMVNEVEPALARADYWERQYHAAVSHSNHQGEILTDMINKDCPDTSGKIKATLNNLLVSHAKTVAACDSTLKEKDKAFAGQVSITKANEGALGVIRSDFRKALRTQDTLQAYIDKIKPKRSISLGGAGNFGNSSAGPAAGYHDTKGNHFGYSLQFINGFKTKQHFISYTRTILIF